MRLRRRTTLLLTLGTAVALAPPAAPAAAGPGRWPRSPAPSAKGVLMRLRRRTTLLLTLGTAVALALPAAPAAADPGGHGAGDGPPGRACAPGAAAHDPGAGGAPR